MAIEDRTEQLERRLDHDEARLDRDEDRLHRDEIQLALDEERLEDEARQTEANRVVALLAIGLGVALVVAVTALVLSLAALRRDVHALAHAVPAGSVSTAAIQDGAVIAPKLGDGAVGTAAVAHQAIRAAQLAPHAVHARAVAPNALTGAQIRERTLARVPSARYAGSAARAGNATALGGLPATAYISHLVTVEATTPVSTAREKGPLTAQCPSGTRALSGGAEVRGVAHGVAILRSAPLDSKSWLGRAAATGHASPAWRLVVRAVCGS